MNARLAAASLCLIVVSCGPRPVELGFWMVPLSYQSPRIGGPITSDEYMNIDQTARAEIVNARVWAGLHYRGSGEAGVVLGRRVAAYDLAHAFRPIR